MGPMNDYYEYLPDWNWTVFTEIPPTPLNDPSKNQIIRRVEHRVIGYIHKH